MQVNSIWYNLKKPLPHANEVTPLSTISQSECLINKYQELNAELSALKSFLFEQFYVIKKTVADLDMPSQNLDYVQCLKEEIKYLREENKIKSDVIKTLSEKQDVILNQKANENISITNGLNFQAKSKDSIDLSQLVSTKTSKNDIIPSNNITNATNSNYVNITIKKVLHNNQDTEYNKITKENDVYNNDSSKNVAEEHRSKKLAIK